MTSAENLCLSCHHPLDADASFCGECGAPRVAASPAAQEQAPPRAPRKRKPTSKAPAPVAPVPDLEPPTSPSPGVDALDPDSTEGQPEPEDDRSAAAAGEAAGTEAPEAIADDNGPVQLEETTSEAHDESDTANERAAAAEELAGARTSIEDEATREVTPQTVATAEGDAVAALEQALAAAAEPTPETEESRDRRRGGLSRRHVLWLGVGVIALLGVAGGTAIAGTALSASSASPGGSATKPPVGPSVTTLPGWSSTPTWRVSGSKVAVMAANGSALALVRDDGRVEVIDASDGGPVATLRSSSGGAVTVHPLEGDALVAVFPGELMVWRAAATVTVPLDANAKTSLRSGRLLVFAGQDVKVLVGDALIPYLPPFDGASAVAPGDGDTLLWASAKKQLIGAGSLGAAVSTTTLLAPDAAPTSTITRWVGVLAGHLYLVWTLADGQTVLASHPINGGSSAPASTQPVLHDAQKLVAADGSSTAMFGAIVVDLATGQLSTPAADFSPARAIGTAFVGSTATSTAVLGADGTLTPCPTPTVIPLGQAADGSLVVLDGDELAAFPRL